jgi:Flp pilus assembly CpaF family ATPase
MASITIRKFGKNKLFHRDLIKFGSLTPKWQILQPASSQLEHHRFRRNGSGKNSLINVLSGFIPMMNALLPSKMPRAPTVPEPRSRLRQSHPKR